jgi:phage gp36-like protein
MNNLNAVLELIFFQFCSVAKYIFAIRIASDVIKKSNENDIQGIIHAVISGGIGYGCLYSIVSVLDAVQNSFVK